MQQEQESAQLCLNGCGFFGNPASGGMCSVCYRKHLSSRQVDKVEATPTTAKDVAPAVTSDADSAQAKTDGTVAAATVEPAAAAAAAAAAAQPSGQKNKKRCWACKKKVGLTAIECRCGFVFCQGHRYPDQHACSFDFKAADRAELARRNPGGGQFGKVDKL